MADLDVSFLINDPDFSDTLTLIRRSYTINEFGENILSETSSIITVIVQSDKGDSSQTLVRTQQSALLSDGIYVHYQGQLIAEGTPNFYADILDWNGVRYQVKSIEENFMNYGAGFTRAFCVLESASV